MPDNYPNKIDENEVKRLIHCKLAGCEYTYRHSDDCRMQGCPSHIARFSYQSTSDIFTLDFGDGSEITLDSTQMNLVHDWIERLRN